MGYGDEIMATGMARGAKARGKRVAFGDGNRIIFSPWSKQIFYGNPNIAHPGEERASDIEWIAHYKGSRLYNRPGPGRWFWNEDFRPTRGEIFFRDDELKFAEQLGPAFIVVEPNVPWHKTVAPNKDWGEHRYNAVAQELRRMGHQVIQFWHDASKRRVTSALKVPSFRHSLAVLSHAALFIGPEGGLHHGAAAVGIPAVVLFGGFIPPSVTGYPTHANLTGGSTACGKITRCVHCRQAMDAITVGTVLAEAHRFLRARTRALEAVTN